MRQSSVTALVVTDRLGLWACMQVKVNCILGYARNNTIWLWLIILHNNNSTTMYNTAQESIQEMMKKLASGDYFL